MAEGTKTDVGGAKVVAIPSPFSARTRKNVVVPPINPITLAFGAVPVETNPYEIPSTDFSNRNIVPSGFPLVDQERAAVVPSRESTCVPEGAAAREYRTGDGAESLVPNPFITRTVI